MQLGVATGPIGLAVGLLIVVGAFVAIQRQHRGAGFVMCALGGAAALAMQLLPITPDPQNPGENTAAITLIFDYLELEGFGWVMFVIALTNLATILVAITAGFGRRPGRAKAVLWLTAALYLEILVLPTVAVLFYQLHAWPTFVVIFSLIALRLVPVMGLMVYGITDLILARMPPRDDAEAAAAVFR